MGRVCRLVDVRRTCDGGGAEGAESEGCGLAKRVCRGWPYMAGLPWAARLTCDGEDGYFRLRKFNLLISSR